MINSKVIDSNDQSDSLKAKINQIENQLDVLIEDANTSKDKVIVANKDFIQLEQLYGY